MPPPMSTRPRSRSRIRRLVSARRHRHDQPEGRVELTSPVFTPAVTVLQKEFDSGMLFGGSASATSSTTGSASTSPVNIAARPSSAVSTPTARLQRLFRHQERMAVPGQRLYRSRHLVVHHAVRRRRHRLLAQHASATAATSTTRPDAHRLCRHQLAMGDGLGAACRSRLQGHPELHRRIRVSLHQPRRLRDHDMIGFNGTNAIYNPIYPERRRPRTTSSLACAGICRRTSRSLRSLRRCMRRRRPTIRRRRSMRRRPR